MWAQVKACEHMALLAPKKNMALLSLGKSNYINKSTHNCQIKIDGLLKLTMKIQKKKLTMVKLKGC